MKKLQWCFAICTGICFFIGPQNSWAAEFILSSPQLANGGQMLHEQLLNGFGCSGKNISPELNWKNPPTGTKSFAVTVYDPDAPTGSGWWHWVAFNINAKIRTLPAGAGNTPLSPNGYIQSATDFGKPGYGGACPPTGHGPHRYIFTVYALDVVSLPLDASATAAMVGFHINQHAIETARLTVHYSR